MINRKATRLETVTIYELLKTCCEKNEDGCAVYQEGWSDIRVSKQLALKLSIIANTRREIFGRFPKTRKEAVIPSRDKLAAIETKLVDLADHLRHLDMRLNTHWEKIARLEGKMQLAFPDYDPKNSTSPLGMKHS